VHRIALAAAALPTALLFGATAWADPITPQSDTPCAPDLSGVMTWPQNDALPLVCADAPGGRQWQRVTTPQPPNDRWLSTGPAVTLHVYSPPLWRMGAYVVEEGGALRRQSLSYAEELRPLAA